MLSDADMAEEANKELLCKLIGMRLNVIKDDSPTDVFTLKYYATDRWRQGFKEMYQEGTLCDVTLVADCREFPCHRLVLAAASDYFRAMFTADFREKGADKIEMPLEGVHLKHIVEYIYLGEIDVKKDDIQELFVAAHMLGVTDLQQACSEKLRTHIDISNCVSLYFFASFYDNKELKDYAKNFACRNLAAVIGEASNADLTADQLSELLSFTDIEHKMFPEDVVYTCIQRWLEKDVELRHQHLPRLMEHVRLHHLSEGLKDDLLDNPKLSSMSDIQQQLSMLRYIKQHPNRWHETDVDLESRCESSATRVYFVEKRRTRQAFCTLRLDCGSMVATAQYVPEALVDVQLVPMETADASQLYLMTGSDRSPISIFLMDSYCALKRLKALPSPRKGYTLTCLDDHIYVIGGACQGKLIRTIWRYSPKENSWEKVSPMLDRLRGACAVSYNGELYLFGGETCPPGRDAEVRVSNHAHKYMPSKDWWPELPSMRTARAWASCGVYRDRIYVVGGYTRPKGGLVLKIRHPDFVKANHLIGRSPDVHPVFRSEQELIEQMMDASGSEDDPDGMDTLVKAMEKMGRHMDEPGQEAAPVSDEAGGANGAVGGANGAVGGVFEKMGGANGAISGNDDNSEEIYEKSGFTSDVMGDMIREIYRQSADRESKRHSNPSGEREETDNEIEDSENRKTIPVTRQRTSDRDGEESHDVKPKSFEVDDHDLKNISGAESKNQNENYSRGADASPNKNVALNDILGLVVEQDGHGQDEADDKLEGAMALPLLDCSPPEPRSVNKDIVNKLADEQRVFRIKTREDGSYILVEDKAGVEPRGGGAGLGARPTGRQAWTYGQTDRGPVCETCGCVHAMSDIQPEKPLSSTEVFDVKTKSWTAGPSLPEDFSCVGLIKHKGFLCVIGTKEVEGECKRQMLKLNQEATEWVPFSTKDDDSAALSYFTGTSRADEGYAATSFVVSGMTTSRYGSLYIKGESRAWDRRPFMEDFMDDPFDALYGDVYGGTDDDDYDEYPYYDDYDDDYYDPEF